MVDVAEDAAAAVARTLRQVERISGLREGRRTWLARAIVEDLREADRMLARRLRRMRGDLGGGEIRFSEAQAIAYRAQIRLAIAAVQRRVRGRLDQQAERALQVSARDAVRVFRSLERRFSGITPELRIGQAAELARVAETAGASLLARFDTSIDRYGDAMIQAFERQIRLGMLGGATMDDMVALLTAHGGPRGQVSLAARVTSSGVVRLVEETIPEGLFVRYRYWAERIIRTETMRAYNAARLEAFRGIRDQFPDTRKKIVAVMDRRTALDSLAVTGQVRELEEPFIDGAGRVYLYPPARPNDRETTIPWRASWDDVPRRRRMTGRELALVDPSRLSPQARAELLARLEERAARTPSRDRHAPPR